MSSSHEAPLAEISPNPEDDGFRVDVDAARLAGEVRAAERAKVNEETPDMSPDAVEQLLDTREANAQRLAKEGKPDGGLQYPEEFRDDKKPEDPHARERWVKGRIVHHVAGDELKKKDLEHDYAMAQRDVKEAQKARIHEDEQERLNAELKKTKEEKEAATKMVAAEKAAMTKEKEAAAAAKKEAAEAKRIADQEKASRIEAEARAKQIEEELKHLTSKKPLDGSPERVDSGRPMPIPGETPPPIPLESDPARVPAETPPLPGSSDSEDVIRLATMDIPSNTPPSAGARAYAAELMNQPTIKARVLSGLAWPFKKLGKGVAEVGSWLKFQGKRLDKNVWMTYRNEKTDKAAAKFEGAKAGFEAAKAKKVIIEESIAAIDKEKEDNKEFITPKIARKMERARRDLEMKLIKVQEDQDQSLRNVKLHESRTIAHENKRSEIARHYAELVDNRMKPKREAQQALQEKKSQYEGEIKAWGEKVATYESKIADLEARAKKNPYCKSVFNSQIKAARKTLATSKKEVEKRRNKITGAFGIDNGMFKDNLVDINNTLQKWENNKATYSRIADRKIAQFKDGHYIGATDARDIPYRAPVENVTASGGEYSEEKVRARETALENAPVRYSFDDWVKQWNALNGSTLKLEDTMVEPDILKGYRAEDGPEFTAAGFAAVVSRLQARPLVAAVTKKISAKEVTKLAKETLEMLREKAADAAMAGDTTA